MDLERKRRISNYLSNACELVKLNNPKAARDYVLHMLNEVLFIYQHTDSITEKVNASVFMDKWIPVSRDLYTYGVTDYVKECFGLYLAAKHPVKPADKPKKSDVKPPEMPKDKPSSRLENNGNGTENDLIGEEHESQGWCADLFNKFKTAVVMIKIKSGFDVVSGTGFIIEQNGLLLTNHHVVYNEENGRFFSDIKMKLHGSNKLYKVDLIFAEEKNDIALCRFYKDELKDATITSIDFLEDYDTLMQGADCLVIGNAFGMGLAPFMGTVRFTKNQEGDLVYTAPSNPGDSGGPVFNRNGKCIGINKSTTVTINDEVANSYSNATPSDTIIEILCRWMEKLTNK
ncbi:MAG: trypsin-like peptidase domain-containing protein [Clostridia bacterium]|nr:trypsin-like peptidase domain-containing protein [Clostridia bacterium]